MKAYCTDEAACRHAALLAYFGERFQRGRCGDACDACLARAGRSRKEDDVWKVIESTSCSAVSPSCRKRDLHSPLQGRDT
jgi:superfamily II DNA helicase RecQ